jgi:hypothetical protein
MSTPLPRPAPTEAEFTAAEAIYALAVHTDTALSTLAVALLTDTKATTNGNGDITLTFPTLAAVTGVCVLNVYGVTGTTVQQLQVPVWIALTGAPSGTAWVRAFSTLTGAGLANHPVRVNAVGWGPPR